MENSSRTAERCGADSNPVSGQGGRFACCYDIQTMTRDTRFDGDITTSEAFVRTLADLIRVAHANGIDVSGAWECRNGDGAPDWEAIITELATADDD